MKKHEAIFWILPYALWMGLMLALPSDASSYTVRMSWTSAALVMFLSFVRFRTLPKARNLLWGAGVGVLVLALWVLPEPYGWYHRLFIFREGGTDAIATSPWALKAARLIGSAFVIAPAEELFFRGFLYRWLQNRDWHEADPRHFDGPSFLWMVVLFALEHDRWLVGAVAGALYGLVAIRRGLAAAVVAHVVTNLLLGLYVLKFGVWALW